jgi:hypothetical protein
VGEYDKSQPLIIDPLVLVYSTYLGGNANDIAGGIVIDSSGYVYIAGRTASTDFPTLNQYMSDPADSYEDAFVTKLDTTQSGISCLLYSSYFGGSDDDIGWDLVIDSNGYVYIIGETNSTDFPCLNQYMSDPGDSDYDAFVTKIDPSQSGTSSLLYSTYLGGNGLDEGYGIAADSSGNAYVTGSTESTDFPNLNQYQTDQSYVDGYVTKLDTTQSGSSCLKYSTYLGGGDKDDGLGIALGSSGNVFVTGRTTSSDFPTINQYQTDQASEDAFLTRIDTTQSGSSSLIYSTYLGGGSTELGYKLAADNSGVAYIVGQTNSTDYPVLNQFMSDPGDGTVDAFVTKIDTAQSGSSSFIYSTYLGGNGWDWARALAVDSSSNVYVTGYTESTDFPVRYQYQTVQGNGDTFISKVDTTKSGTPCLIYSTYLGASDRDSGTGVAFDSSGKIYVTGYSDSIDFPTLNQYMTDPGDSDNDGFVTKLTMVTLGVTSPNGGEDWTINTTHNITWDATGLSNPLYIILQQNGVNVALIQKNIDPSLGTYSWTVGDYRQGGVVANTNCKILLKHKDFAVKDKSDAVFTISNPYVTVTAPNGGEDWQIGTTENITWDSAGLTNTLYIVLQQNGVNVALIQKIIDPSLGTYSWSVGDCRLGIVVAGTNYKIILKEKDSTVKDKSNGGFVISN